MTVMNSFVSFIMAAVTTFTGTFDEPNVRPAPDIPYTPIQAQIDEAAQVAQGSGIYTGITIIDRAHGNLMKSNADAAHHQFTMESAGRLPILLYAARIDEEVGKGNVPDIASMMQGFSGEATERLWTKYGGTSIIGDVAKRYNLQETTAGSGWRDTKTSAVDIGRMYRRFLDDDGVDVETKKYVIQLLRSTSPTVVGEDMSFGLPTAMGAVNTGTVNEELAWVQGWSPSGSDPMIRTTSGVIGEDMRYIVVIASEVVSDIDDAAANATLNQVAQTLIGGNNAGSLEGTFGPDDQELGREFSKMQEEIFGDFVKNN